MANSARFNPMARNWLEHNTKVKSKIIMKPIKLITSLAAVACALAVSSARAQSSITNLVTFNVLTYTELGTTTNGSTITYNVAKAPHSSTQLLHEELGPLLNTNGLSAAAKVVLITGNAGAGFAVIDGTNFYDLSSSNIMTLSIGNNKIRAGTQSDASPERKTVDMQVLTVQYDDTSIGGSLKFSLQGLASIAQTDTTPVNGTYTETVKAKATLAGEGSSPNLFVATAVMNVSGHGTLTVP